MVKVAVVFADGCEEVEGLSIVDVLRRLNVECDMVGLTDRKVIGDHKIILTCDKVVDDSLLDYDLVAFLVEWMDQPTYVIIKNYVI